MSSGKFVYNFFYNTMHMSPDTAYIISEIVTVNYNSSVLSLSVKKYLSALKETEKIVFPNVHIPTGSKLSSILAFLAYKEMFDEMYNYAKINLIQMTVYVDDITFSSRNHIPIYFIININKIIKKYDHIPNKKKSKSLSSINNKNVTGVIISNEMKIKIPNKLHYKMKLIRQETKKNPTEKNKQRLNGIKQSMNQIHDISKNEKK